MSNQNHKNSLKQFFLFEKFLISADGVLMLTKENFLKLIFTCCSLTGIYFLICTILFIFCLMLLVTIDSLKIVLGISSVAMIPVAEVVTWLRKKIKGRRKKNQYIFRFLSATLVVIIWISLFFLRIAPFKTYVVEKTSKIYQFLSDTVSNNKENSVIKNGIPNNANFIIDNDDLSDNLSNELYSNIYLMNVNSEKEIYEYFKNIRGTQISSTVLFSDIQEQEDEFLNAIMDTKSIRIEAGNTDEWKKSLPTEEQLKDVIERQLSFANDNPQFAIYLKLSNNYQSLGLEYYNQKSYSSTIKYYYWRSLQYDFQCVRYAQNDKEYNTAMQRIYKRYEDIRFCCDNTSEEVERINFLLNCLEKYKT